MKYLTIILTMLLWYKTGVAQTNDSVKLYQTFVQVCNAYKQLPLQLNVSCTTTTNLAAHGEDSVVFKGEFIVQNGAAYIHFGNAEQLITDSMMLFVTKDNNQMVLTRGTVNIAAQMSNMLRLVNDDTAIAHFLQRYRVSQKKADGNNDMLELTSRQLVYHSDIPMEIVQLTFNRNSRNPVNVETVKRTMVRKPESFNVPSTVSVITAPDQAVYLLKEDKASYQFTKIEHDPSAAIPVLISDRVVREAGNNYVPVPAYKNFNLIQH